MENLDHLNTTAEMTVKEWEVVHECVMKSRIGLSPEEGIGIAGKLHAQIHAQVSYVRQQIAERDRLAAVAAEQDRLLAEAMALEPEAETA